MEKADAIELGISTQKIPTQEVTAHSLSFSDYNGRLFRWKGGLYRAIPAEQALLYQELFDRGAVRSLSQKNLLVPTALTNLTLGTFPMVLRHRQIPFISYPAEWCSAMLKAAALLHLDLCIALDTYNCTTDDAHPINILFEGCSPCFVDFGSINRLPSDRWYPWPWPPYQQFCQTFLYPLLLKVSGQGRLARWGLHDFENGILKSDLEALIDRPLSRLRLAEVGTRLIHRSDQPLHQTPAVVKPLMRKGYGAAGRLLSRISGIESTRREFLQQVKAEVANIALPSDAKGRPADRVLSKPQNYDLVRQILSNIKPSSVLDIDSGSSFGSYALLAAKTGAIVVAIDQQEDRLNQIYQSTKQSGANVLPVWMNIISPSYGLANNFLEPADRRLKCELVIALSISSELMLKRGFNFVIKRLAAFSSRWLVVEFVPQIDPKLSTRWQERIIDCPWYKLDNFVTALGHQFKDIDVIDSLPEPRKLLICQK